MPTQELPVEVHAALQSGDIIEAIKLLRAATGMGLKEAKDCIEASQRGDAVSFPSANFENDDPFPSLSRPAGYTAEVLTAMQQGNKIEAIKLMREHTGLGLKEAKDAVEAWPGWALQPAPLKARIVGLVILVGATFAVWMLYQGLQG